MATPAEKVDGQNEINVHDIAAECVEQADGDWDAATELMLDRALKDPAVGRAVIQSTVRHLIRLWAHQVRRQYRRNSSQPVGKDNTSGIELVSKRNWYEYPLSSGLPLGKATRVDLRADIDEYNERAASNAHEARRLERILEAMPKRSQKTVAEELSIEQLEAIASEVE